MKPHTPCPSRDRLKQLLDTDDLPTVEQGELVGHLDSCEGCQRSLEEIAAGDYSWSNVCRHVDRDEPAVTSAYWPALQAVEDEVILQADTPLPPERSIVLQADIPVPPEERSAIDVADLDFLGPVDQDGYRGTLGEFKIVDVIGRGGMGVVLKAFDPCLQRHVALKVLDPEVAHDETARKRFCREARAAAAVSHPNVIGVHQVEHEESKDLPFLVMQLVNGMSLEERVRREGRLPLKDILFIGMQTAFGLAAAHSLGLIHRDVKPANILLEDGTGNVKLTDFGLARAAEDVKLTQTGFVAGTPLYMAPEQAKGEAVDHRSDLFSLGSVLYEMCTGKPPFEGNTPFMVLRSVTEEVPRPIRELNPDVPDCLVSTIDRLHAKKPEDRFQSATEVAMLLRQGLAVAVVKTEVQPVCPGVKTHTALELKAAPPSSRRLRLFALSGVALLLAAFALVRIFGVGGGSSGPAPKAVFKGNAGPVGAIAISPDGNSLAMALDDGTVKLWDVPSAQVRATLRRQQGAAVWATAFAPDGKSVASGSHGAVYIWDPETGGDLFSLPHEGTVRSLAYSRDGALLAVGLRNGNLVVWDMANKKARFTALAHTAEVVSVAFSPDGHMLATSGKDRIIRLWDLRAGQERLTLPGHEGGVYSVAYSPDGKTLASGGYDQTARLWTVASGEEKAVLHGHTQDVWSVAFSPDGSRLVTGSEDHTVRIWDVATGHEVIVFKGHMGSVYSVAWTPDGRTVASGSRDGTVKLWDVPK